MTKAPKDPAAAARGRLARKNGQKGELEVRNLLVAHGFQAQRGQQFKGTKDSPDVIHNMEGFHIEVKLRSTASLVKWLEQAATEAPDLDPLVFYRSSGKPWTVTLYADDFLKLMDQLYTKE